MPLPVSPLPLPVSPLLPIGFPCPSVAARLHLDGGSSSRLNLVCGVSSNCRASLTTRPPQTREPAAAPPPGSLSFSPGGDSIL